mmetsp:Transcript_76391/g.210976  ORF Transcript_76391/g.210976 Transcript_76391/m.210976 type:complete len:457 (-) Transcript_76391:63-1433(-)
MSAVICASPAPTRSLLLGVHQRHGQIHGCHLSLAAVPAHGPSAAAAAPVFSWILTVSSATVGLLQGALTGRAVHRLKSVSRQQHRGTYPTLLSAQGTDGGPTDPQVSAAGAADEPSGPAAEVASEPPAPGPSELTSASSSVAVLERPEAEDPARRNLLVQGAFLAFGASVFFPAGRQVPWYQWAISQLDNGAGGVSLDDANMLRAVAQAVPRPAPGVATRVLDVGAGSGGDLRFILGADLPSPLEIVAVEPNSFTWAKATAQARQLGIAVPGETTDAASAVRRASEPDSSFTSLTQLADGPRGDSGAVPMELDAEGDMEGPTSGKEDLRSLAILSFVQDVAAVPSGSVSLAVCKSVLCSVEDPRAVVREVFRALRPGGVLAFVEHIAAEEGSILRPLQQIWRPFQQAFANGCDPARDTYKTIQEACPWDRVYGKFFEVQGDGPIAPHVRGFAVKPA